MTVEQGNAKPPSAADDPAEAREAGSSSPSAPSSGDRPPHDVADLLALADDVDPHALAEAAERQEAPDAADMLETLEEEAAGEVLGNMEDHAAALALAEMQIPLAIGVLDDIIEEEPKYASLLLQLMAPDDAADLLQALPEGERKRLLALMSKRRAADIGRLVTYERESAGGLMTTDFLSLHRDMTVQQAIDHIRATVTDEDIVEALVVDDGNHLVGALGLRKLLLAKPADRVADLMTAEVDALPVAMDREEVARAFDRYDHTMMPVVDHHHRLLGVVTVDDVIDIIRQEQTEDVQRTVGAGKGEAVYSPLSEKVRGRFPWMVASTVLTCTAGSVLLMAEGLIAELPVLAFVMAVIAPLAGNAGHQALAVTLRGIVLDEVRADRVAMHVVRESAVGLLIGVVVGALLSAGLYGYLEWTGGADWHFALVPLLATPVAMAVGTFAGAGIPLAMRRFGFDPAHASAIVLIMITDGVSFLATVSLTMAYLRVFV